MIVEMSKISVVGENLSVTRQTGRLQAWFSRRQELIRRWDSERELLRSASGSYPNSL